jgi:uncharacterized protein (DUF2336 family)
VSNENKLNASDVAQLLANPSADARKTTATKLGAQFSAGGLSDKERGMAEEIFRLMARDVEVKVRAALSQSIRLSPELPRDIALAMANDVEDVALPFIELSSVLNDDDLLQIIATKPAQYQVAVAGRTHVSEMVADALVDTGSEAVVARLVSNDGAQLSEGTMGRVLDGFGHIKQVSNPMAQRSVLPIRVAERLVSLVSEKIKDHLVVNHAMSADIATDLLMDSRERATLHLIDGDSDALDVVELVEQLNRNGRLSPTIILRALCMGDITFFEAALAKKAGIPVANAYQLVHDKGGTGLQRLFDRCGMPPKMLPIARVALGAVADLSLSIGDDRQVYRQMVLERVLTTCEEAMGDDLDYLIAKLVGRAGSPSALHH